MIQIGIWLSAAHFLNRLIIIFVWEGALQRTLGAPVPRLVKDIFTIIIYVIAITGIVGVVFKKSVTGFWTTSGIIGLILGFALKNVILDVFTGLAINIDRSYKIGDWIKVHGIGSGENLVGQIIEINWRTTRLHTEDDSIVVLPNSLLGTQVVTNYWGAGPESRFETEPFCLDFSVPIERAKRILSAGAMAVVGQKGILENPQPQVMVNGTKALGVEYKVRFWMQPWQDGITQGAAKSLVTTSILEHLKQAGITPAYPKQDIFYAEMPKRYFDVQSVKDKMELLHRAELFKHLNKQELQELAENMKLRRFAQGTKIIKQGEAGDSMFIVSEGLLHAYIQTGTNNNQTEIKVGQIEPGEFFGEMSLLTGAPRSATIVAATDVIVHEITKDHMNTLFSRRPEIVETISLVIAERKLRNSKTLQTATPEERIEQTQSLAGQIVSKIKSFFKGVFEKSDPSLAEI